MPGVSDSQNMAIYGPESLGEFGHGHNYVAWFAFHGDVDRATGMAINVATIKERLLGLIETRYDHKYLNVDTPPFDSKVPTPENLSRELLADAVPLFEKTEAQPVACHLSESGDVASTTAADGRVERDHWLDFSAARRTYSPNLSDKENRELFGAASSPAGHGHHYRARFSFDGEVDWESGRIRTHSEIDKALMSVSAELDHKNLNIDVAAFKDKPMTTEIIVRHLFESVARNLPLRRVCLWENRNFFVEYDRRGHYQMGIRGQFNAAHRLHSESLSAEENVALYDKCNNAHGHGHRYELEATIVSDLDERTGICYDLLKFSRCLAEVLAGYDNKHLDRELEQFAGIPSTGENIVQALWRDLESEIGNDLVRVRLWETPNNRFTLRREIGQP